MSTWSETPRAVRQSIVFLLILIAAALAGTALLAWLLLFTDAVIAGHS